MVNIYKFRFFVLIIVRIIFIGPTGVGKTTLSVELSKHLGIPFFNIDNYLHETLQFPLQSRYSLEEYQNKRLREDSIIEHISKRHRHFIVSAGAGFSNGRYDTFSLLSFLQSTSTIIYLEKNSQTISKEYLRYAHCCLYVENRRIDEILQEIFGIIGCK